MIVAPAPAPAPTPNREWDPAELAAWDAAATDVFGESVRTQDTSDRTFRRVTFRVGGMWIALCEFVDGSAWDLTSIGHNAMWRLKDEPRAAFLRRYAQHMADRLAADLATLAAAGVVPTGCFPPDGCYLPPRIKPTTPAPADTIIGTATESVEAGEAVTLEFAPRTEPTQTHTPTEAKP